MFELAKSNPNLILWSTSSMMTAVATWFHNKLATQDPLLRRMIDQDLHREETFLRGQQPGDREEGRAMLAIMRDEYCAVQLDDPQAVWGLV
jgi:hypothetical protein